MTVKIDDFSRIIKQHRKLIGLSQKELADLAGVGKTVIFDLEKGKATVRFLSQTTKEKYKNLIEERANRLF